MGIEPLFVHILSVYILIVFNIFIFNTIAISTRYLQFYLIKWTQFVYSEMIDRLL